MPETMVIVPNSCGCNVPVVCNHEPVGPEIEGEIAGLKSVFSSTARSAKELLQSPRSYAFPFQLPLLFPLPLPFPSHFVKVF